MCRARIPKRSRLLIFLIALFLSQSFMVVGQSRAYIRDAITEWGQCRNVAITETNGDLALYDDNGYAYDQIPSDQADAIEELRNNDEYISDIQLTENGRWIVLYGANGLKWSNIPGSLESQLREYNTDNEVITSVTFNDVGEWVIISEDFYSSSDANITDWLKAGADKYGVLWAACITNDALVAVYERGYKYFGEVPEDLKNKLQETSFDVYRIKIAGTAWFFADKYGRYDYNM